MTNATEVRERPILFSTPMVRALLDGRKTQTRRVAMVRSCGVLVPALHYDAPPDLARCPYGAPGDRLWVRESHAILDMRSDVTTLPESVAPTAPWLAAVTYAADDSEARYVDGVAPADWRASYDADHVIVRPSIHMPRWACRLVLELTDVRVERLQAITDSDALAEGVWHPGPDADPDEVDRSYDARDEFRRLWNSLNEPRDCGWDLNPWVWVLVFQRAEATDA